MKPDDELRKICSQIVDAQRSEKQWAEIESDDMFQSPNYSGGFDADENEFCFSLYRAGKELWFQLTLDEATKVAKGQSAVDIELREAE